LGDNQVILLQKNHFLTSPKLKKESEYLMDSKTKSYLSASLIMMIVMLAIPMPPAAAENEQNVTYETGFYYTVQKGDTLWDLSQKFSDTPWQWPEMWKENDQIANPHRIYPGERIRLYRRRDAGGYGEGSSGANKNVEDKSELTKLVNFEYAAIDRVGFIRKEPILPHGTIFKVEGQKEMISTGDLVYIKPRENFALMPGDKYTVYRTLKPIKDSKTNEFIGFQHYFTGAVEIMIKRPEFVVGRIVATYRPIKVGDLMMPYMSRMQSISMAPSPPGLEGTIIGSEEHEGIFGENTIAFIDKGKSAGVEPGQLYWIFKQEKYRLNPDKDNEITLTPVILGELMVLHIENTTATVMITDSRRTIEPGARIITPFKLD
jgi:LysM repeat protein